MGSFKRARTPTSSPSPPRCSKAWAAYVREVRIKQKLTKRDAARLLEIDPSYLTFMERDGLIPRLNTVAKIGKTLDDTPGRAEFVAGYVPECYAEPFRILFEFLSGRNKT